MTVKASVSQAIRDLDTLMWCDEDILFDRHTKTAASLIAVHRVLETNLASDPGVSEFLRLFERLKQLANESFTRVWTEPSAYYWVRTAYQLAGQVLNPAQLPKPIKVYMDETGETDPFQALLLHLHQFKGIVLGACYSSGQDLSLETPLEVELPYALPGTPLYLEGQGKLHILGMVSGALEFRVGGNNFLLPLDNVTAEAIGGVTLEQCPIIEHGECVLYMQPYSLDWPGVEFVKPAIEAGIGFQSKHQDRIVQALDLIQQCAPAVYGQFSEFMHSIVLKPLNSGSYSNLSHSDFPGTAIIGFYDNPYVLADAIIHEFHHNRLFCIEELGAFFNDSNHLEDSGYYSPWRHDLRPLHGVYHAVYVHIPVAEFWLKLLAEDTHLEPLTKLLARDRVIRIVLQNRIGIRQLEDYGDLTTFGAEILAHMKSYVKDLQQRTLAAGFGFDAPAMSCRLDGSIVPEKNREGQLVPTVMDSIRDHIRCYDIENQCATQLTDPAFLTR